MTSGVVTSGVVTSGVVTGGVAGDRLTVVLTLVAAAALAAAGTAVLCAARVRRLHRLHQRLDAARGGLDRALESRAAAARRAGLLVAALPGREAAANALGRALARLDRAALPAPLRAELAEAEELLVLARHVHNEAVRDTLGLRSRRLVRWLRLAGTAPMPAYFETVDPAAVTRAAPGGQPA